MNYKKQSNRAKRNFNKWNQEIDEKTGLRKLIPEGKKETGKPYKNFYQAKQDEIFVPVWDYMTRYYYTAYYVSNYGTVISGKGENLIKLKTSTKRNNEYYTVSFSDQRVKTRRTKSQKAANQKSRDVHRIVWYAFAAAVIEGTIDVDVKVGKEEWDIKKLKGSKDYTKLREFAKNGELEIHHIDGDTKNNHQSNLQLIERNLHRIGSRTTIERENKDELSIEDFKKVTHTEKASEYLQNFGKNEAIILFNGKEEEYLYRGSINEELQKALSIPHEVAKEMDIEGFQAQVITDTLNEINGRTGKEYKSMFNFTHTATITIDVQFENVKRTYQYKQTENGKIEVSQGKQEDMPDFIWNNGEIIIDSKYQI